MGIKTKLDAFSKNTYIVFFLAFFKIIEIIKPLFKKMNFPDFIKQIDWFDLGYSAAILIVLYSALKSVAKLKEQLLTDNNALSQNTKALDEKIENFNTKYEEY